jgi:putative DNA-invertase from lambdoid prophage Rac
MAVFGYCRVSKDAQVEKGISLEEQERMVIGRAMEMDWLLTKTFVEKGVSGSTPFVERPEGGRLFAQLHTGDVVIAAKLDRMFRSAIDCLTVVRDFQERRISLWLLDMGGDVSGNGLAKLFLTMAAGFAEFERTRIGERVRDAKRHQRDAGKYLGGDVPFGFRRGAEDQIEKDSAAQAALVAAREMREVGRTFRAIAQAIKEEFNIPISAATVRRALQRDAAGRVCIPAMAFKQAIDQP